MSLFSHGKVVTFPISDSFEFLDRVTRGGKEERDLKADGERNVKR